MTSRDERAVEIQVERDWDYPRPPPADVRADLLTPSSARSTWCEYKGAAGGKPRQCRWLPAQIIVAKTATVSSISATAKMSPRSITQASSRAGRSRVSGRAKTLIKR